MKKIRLISPYISLLLIILVLSGSFGFTLIHHSCFHCGTNETYAAFSGDEVEQGCCCHPAEDPQQHQAGTEPVSSDECCNSIESAVSHNQGAHEFNVTDDCCSHKAERIVTDELLRAEKQTGIVPYFLAATVIAVIGKAPVTDYRNFAGDSQFHRGSDLTTLFCRLQS